LNRVDILAEKKLAMSSAVCA